MEIEFIDIEKTKLTWPDLRDDGTQFFVFMERADAHLCKRVSGGFIWVDGCNGNVIRDYRSNDPIYRVRIHKIVCEKVVEQ